MAQVVGLLPPRGSFSLCPAPAFVASWGVTSRGKISVRLSLCNSDFHISESTFRILAPVWFSQEGSDSWVLGPQAL